MDLKVIDTIKTNDANVLVGSKTGKLKGDIFFFIDDHFNSDRDDTYFSFAKESGYAPGDKVSISQWYLCVPAKNLYKIFKRPLECK